jgi:L-threonylcarbamoyladenylate synthase
MKPAETLHIDATLVDNALTLWREGKLVAIPTETVYGLAADATMGQAVASIYAMKSRPAFNPLIVHVASIEMAQAYGVWSAQAEALARAFWPGPLTLVLPSVAGSAMCDLVSAGGDTVAVRMPNHPIARQLIAAYGRGIAAPSANRSGRISPTTAQHVRDEFGSALPLIIDGGACTLGLESTVVDLSGAEPALLRPGSITAAMLASHLPTLVLPSRATGTSLKSPGLLHAHYAPSIPLRLDAQSVASDEALLAFGPHPLPGAAATCNLSPEGSLIDAAANLFAMMRLLDQPSYRAIAVMPIPDDGVGVAICDRLQRASAAHASLP